ncbi:MAG: GNAT family N-acetyltransferase [Blastocatellia bacterium]
MSIYDSRQISLRPALEGDEEFLLEVYAGTRSDEMAQTGWDDAQQRAFLKLQFVAQQQHYRSYYPQGEHQLILLNEKPIGRLYVARSPEEIRILDIALLAEHRNKGIGTSIIKDLMEESAKTGKPVRIYVENFNRALRLFERKGFLQIEEKGFHYLMQWQQPIAE